MEVGEVLFFESPAEMRDWLEHHHAAERELWVGYHRVATRKPSLTWSQSVDEALCYGWIDGIRKGLDESSYANRFTPRKRGSTWSRVNVDRAAELTRLGRMRPAGQAAFEARSNANTGIYSYEQAPRELDADALARFHRNPDAWAWFSGQAPSYRRTASHWVNSAKREETRRRRLEQLIDDSAHGLRVAPLRPPGSAKPG